MLRLCVFLLAFIAAETVTYDMLKERAVEYQPAPLLYEYPADDSTAGLCVWEPITKSVHAVNRQMVDGRKWVHIAIKTDSRFVGKDSAVLDAFYTDRVDDGSILYISSDVDSGTNKLYCDTSINLIMNLTTVYLKDPLEKVAEALIDLTNQTMNLTTVCLNLEERLDNVAEDLTNQTMNLTTVCLNLEERLDEIPESFRKSVAAVAEKCEMNTILFAVAFGVIILILCMLPLQVGNAKYMKCGCCPTCCKNKIHCLK